MTASEEGPKARLARVRAVIAAACGRAGRAVDAVELVAVSKLQPLDAVVGLAEAGQRVFGENYAQSLRDRAAALDARFAGLAWHAIGPLQRNKVKYVARAAAAFHALDDLGLAVALGERRLAERPGAPIPCYVEVNIAGEASKHGVAPEAVPALVDAVRGVPGVVVVGLMCMPPLPEPGPDGVVDPEASRPHFRRLRALAASVGLAGLSMGTTSDYAVAVEEGATAVRVGRELFGGR